MKEILENLLSRLDKLGIETRELVFESPATEEELLTIEEKLGYKIPEDFRNTCLTVSKHCEFRWFLPDEFELPDEFDEIFCGDLHWGTKFILQFNENKDGWEKEVFPNLEDEYDKVWHNKFAFYEVGNGDLIAIDLDTDTYGQIVYLSHDDGEGHGYVMANSFTELLRNWVQLACPGGEDWQWLPFIDNKTNGINPNSENAKKWQKLLGI